VTDAAIPHDLIQAFLTAGATAVICWDAKSGSSSYGAEVASYFKEFYGTLFGKAATVSAAMEAAGGYTCFSGDMQCTHICPYVCAQVSFPLQTECQELLVPEAFVFARAQAVASSDTMMFEHVK